jgi:hypothetical protein
MAAGTVADAPRSATACRLPRPPGVARGGAADSPGSPGSRARRRRAFLSHPLDSRELHDTNSRLGSGEGDPKLERSLARHLAHVPGRRIEARS